jgi:signal transduction histidine kinase
MRIGSEEKKIFWYVAMVFIIAVSIVVIFYGRIIVSVLWFTLAMILANTSFFMDDAMGKASRYLLTGGIFAVMIFCPVWYLGLLTIPVLSYALLENAKTDRILRFLLCAFSFGILLYKESPDLIFVLIALGSLIAAYLLMEICLMVFRKYTSTNEKLGRALTASAVDAMEQRSLREQLAKSMSINEHNARLEERERISRDIHNSVGHTLSAATVTLEAASMLVPNDQERAREKIDVANSRVHEAISSVRSVVRTLDAEDDCIELCDYMKSLESMTREFMMDTEIKIYSNFSQIDQEGRLPIGTASFLSSSLSELLTNGVKHGDAKIFVVTFIYDTKNVRLKVQDNGCGFGKLSANEKKILINNGFGLRKMLEYAEKHGGSCVIESEDGFTVSLSLPLEG